MQNIDLKDDLHLKIARGEYNNISTVFKFGRNESVGATEVPVWDGATAYTYLTEAETLSVVSDSALDVDQGDGAWNVIVYGLDENFEEIQETVVLNGTTPVITTNSFLRTFRAVVITTGTDTPVGGGNLGNITFTASTSAVLQAKILANEAQTLMCIYTVPAGKTAYITGGLFSIGQGKDCVFKGKFRNCTMDNCSFSNKFTIELFENALQADFKTPLAVPEKTDIIITAKNGATTVSASASWGMIIIDN